MRPVTTILVIIVIFRNVAGFSLWRSYAERSTEISVILEHSGRSRSDENEAVHYFANARARLMRIIRLRCVFPTLPRGGAGLLLMNDTCRISAKCSFIACADINNNVHARMLVSNDLCCVSVVQPKQKFDGNQFVVMQIANSVFAVRLSTAE